MIYVVHCKRHKDCEYVGRPSVLGNPYPLKKGQPRGSTIERYRKYLRRKIADNDADIVAELNRLADMAQDGDLYLGCWCNPHPCHADVIREEIQKILEVRSMPKKKDFIVIIAGSRGFEDYDLLEEKCDRILEKVDDSRNIIIRSGGAKGADKFGEKYARRRKYTIQRFIPDWRPNGVYDKTAGHKRNREMADGNREYPAEAHALIAFWDFESTGTKGMIDYATKKGMQVRKINYTKYEDEGLPNEASYNQVYGDAIQLFKYGNYDALCVTTNGILKKDKTLVMGRGIAKDVSDAYPHIARELGEHVREFGNISTMVDTDDGYVISFPTKHHWRDNSDIDLIVESMESLVHCMNKFKLKRVLLPRPGVSNGGLNWDDVYEAIEPYVDERITFVSKK